MSREETLQAMKDIGSQYGDAVIVEFSGDGMAALVENKKGIVDANVTQEQDVYKRQTQCRIIWQTFHIAHYYSIYCFFSYF